MEITLASGETKDLTGLDEQALWELQFEQERAFAERIKTTALGSQDRAETIRQGYDSVCRILAQMEPSSDVPEMGFDRRYLRLVLKLLKRRRGSSRPMPSLFEIGYGCGAMLEQVAAAGFGVAGIEVSDVVREEALRRVPDAHHQRMFLGDLTTHTLGGECEAFDVVYWNDVFEHVPPDEIDCFLTRAFELLRPGGCLVTITPNWHERPSDVTGDFLPPRTEALGLHLKEYTLGEVTSLLQHAGFDRIDVPLLVTRRRIWLAGSGMAGLKRRLEPGLEWLPFRTAELLCHALGLSYTIAHKPNGGK